MKKQTKFLIASLVTICFLATPMFALAGGFPPGDNSTSNVGVPKEWEPSSEASSWGSSGSQESRLPKGGNDRANVGVPKAWMPK